ncbi:MAG TPA: hypothetical protein VNE61_01615 [Ktedonobacteraceae bacterium]|nr:hypothetical protein [Ktedonobacteraceae bacterium]
MARRSLRHLPLHQAYASSPALSCLADRIFPTLVIERRVVFALQKKKRLKPPRKGLEALFYHIQDKQFVLASEITSPMNTLIRARRENRQ